MGYKKLFSTVHPEANIDGFTVHDSAVAFYSLVRAAILQTDATNILDYGAGRGSFWYINTKEEGSLLRKSLRDLRSPGRTVTACDIDPAVLEHPCSQRQLQIYPRQPLPFADESFDLIVSDMVVEHVENPQEVCAELLRVLRPGGFVCLRTPNKWSYVPLAATLVPNRLHAKALTTIQPNRQEKDVFPTFYRMNTTRQLCNLFKGNSVHVTKFFADPAYHFNSTLVFRLFRILHWLLPRPFAPVMFAFIRKAGD